MSGSLQRLLLDGDAPAVEIVNPRGSAPLLLTGDHAGNAIPAALGTLGIGPAEMQRHIAWDIGVDALGRDLAQRLDAVFVCQHYSRLVIDCNRDPASDEAMPASSDGTPVPANIGLDAAARQQRVAAIHTPYHAAIAAALADRPADHALVALHSFTPSMGGIARPWEIGVLHDGASDGLARRMLAWLIADGRHCIGDNAPYRMDATDYSVPRHAFAAGRLYLELEIRQDLLGDAAGVAAMTAYLAQAITATL